MLLFRARKEKAKEMKEHDEKGKKLYPFTAAACQVPACSAANSSQTVSPTMSDDEIATRSVVGITRNGNRAGGPIDSSMDGRHEFLPKLPNARQTDPTTGRVAHGKRRESRVCWLEFVRRHHVPVPVLPQWETLSLRRST